MKTCQGFRSYIDCKCTLSALNTTCTILKVKTFSPYYQMKIKLIVVSQLTKDFFSIVYVFFVILESSFLFIFAISCLAADNSAAILGTTETFLSTPKVNELICDEESRYMKFILTVNLLYDHFSCNNHYI